MKGLEIAKSFFFEWGYPFLKQEFPVVSSRIAAGRFFGSDVLGGDDEISRDHNWGPQFSLFLSTADYASFGNTISEKMNEAAPKTWKGHRVAGGGDMNVQVFSIPVWFNNALGLLQNYPTREDWSRMAEKYESNLYFIRHGALWVDGTGEITALRNALNHYPDEQRIRRIAEECFNVWHFGEYNFLQRISQRLDPIAVTVCLGEFIKAVMKIQLLLHGDYTPYWKWLSFIFRKQAYATPYIQPIEKLSISNDNQERVDLVRVICKSIHEQMVSMGVVTGKDGNEWLLPLLNDYYELINKLKNWGN